MARPKVCATASGNGSKANNEPRITTMAIGQVGRYRLEDEIKRGGMGVVYRATELPDKRTCAVKLIAEHWSDDAEYRGRFAHEAKALMRLSHPHILHVYEADESEGRLFIAMPLVNGRDLGEILRDSEPFTPAEAVDLLAQIVGAVDTAHSKGIIHRDIKPANILVEVQAGFHYAYLFDFGIALLADTVTRYTIAGDAIGTLPYMAPERLAAGPSGEPADIYALGGCLFAMLSGDPPPIGGWLTTDDPRLVALGPLGPVVAKAMARDPGDRYAPAKQLLDSAIMALGPAGRPANESSVTVTSSEGSALRSPKPLFRIGTLGHFHHGKTTLTAALTQVCSRGHSRRAYQYDELSDPVEERHRGIVMAAAQVEYETRKRQYDHVDCHAHADCVKNLISGASSMDAAILVVSAIDGVMPQTREQVLLARRVNVPRIVVFLSMIDEVDDPNLCDLVEEEVRALLDDYDFSGDEVPVVMGSALKALEGDAAEQQAILELASELDSYLHEPAAPLEMPLLMPIEDVFPITGRGAVATGRIEQGVVSTGDEVEVVGLRESIRAPVTGIEMFRQILDKGGPGDNVGVLLRGIAGDSIERGQVLCTPGSHQPHSLFKAEVYWLLPDEGGRKTPLFTHYRPQFYFRTTDVEGIADLPSGVDMALPGEHITISVILSKPVAMEPGLHFAMREGGRTVGAGVVVETLN
jgi:elongation factor Tu